MRQGQSRSVFAEDLLVWTVGPPSTSTDCLGADTATAITALLNWDLAHMPAWTAYLNTTNIIPQGSIEMVQAYFTLAGRRIPRTP